MNLINKYLQIFLITIVVLFSLAVQGLAADNSLAEPSTIFAMGLFLGALVAIIILTTAIEFWNLESFLNWFKTNKNTIRSVFLVITIIFIVIIVIYSLHDKSPDKRNQSIQLYIQALVGIGVIIGISFAYLRLRASEKLRIHQVLSPLILEYRSSEMLRALRELHNLREAHKDDIVEEYFRIKKRDDRIIAALKPELKLEMEKTTLHHHRRYVGGFWSLVAGLYYFKIIPARMLHWYWSKNTLSILPNIIIPIEEALFETTKENSSDETPPMYELMRELYKGWPDNKPK